MTNLITEQSESVFHFELREFLSTQATIYSRFPIESKGIDKIDKYLFQIIEEIQEVNASKDHKYRLEESIDVVMYLGSIVNLFADDFEDTIFDNQVILRKNDIIDSKVTMDNLFSDLINARRMYPERKWHKSFSSDDINNDRASIFLQIVLNNISSIIEMLLTQFSNNFISDTINKKQLYILKLDVPHYTETVL